MFRYDVRCSGHGLLGTMKQDPFTVPRPPNGTARGRPSDFEMIVGQHVMALKHSICLDHDRLLELRTRELQEEIADLQKENIALRRTGSDSQSNDVCKVALRRHVLSSVTECPLPPANETSEVFEVFDFPSVLRSLADKQEQALEVFRSSMAVCDQSNGYHDDASKHKTPHSSKAGNGELPVMNGIMPSSVSVSVIDDRKLNKNVSTTSWGNVRIHEPWPIWKDCSTPSQSQQKVERQLPAVLGVGRIRGSTMKFDVHHSGCMHRLLINPNSMFCAVWQLLFAVVLTYEIIMFPMGVFELPLTEGPLFVISQMTLTFWTSDLVLSFFTGYTKPDGGIETGFLKIAIRYAKTWLVPDMAVVLVDWVTLLSSSPGSGTKLLRFGKMLRIIRVARLLRLVRLRKLTEAIRRLDDWIDSQYFSTIKSLVVNMAGILMIAHFLGCGWYAIGRVEVPEYGSWVSEYPEITGHSWTYRYVTSLHWSLTQFTPGSMHVQPQNISERLFAISVLVMGMLIFSCIISNITAATNNLKEMTARYDRQLGLLRRFLRQEEVSPELLVRVCIFADSAIKPKMTQVSKQEVTLLNLLPRQLYEEVTNELYGKHIEVHPFFGTLSTEASLTMQKLSSSALDEYCLPRSSLLFKVGDRAHAMYFTTNGTMMYKLDDEEEDPNYVDTVLAQEWFCEPVLWMPWVYQGWMTSASDVDLVTLEHEKFHKVMVESPSSMWLPKQYGLEYVRGVNLLMSGIQENGLGPRNNRVSDLLVISSAIRLVQNAPASGQ